MHSVKRWKNEIVFVFMHDNSSFVALYDRIWLYHTFFLSKSEKGKKRGWRTKGDVLYYDSRADESGGHAERAWALERRRMYPENYTMQNKLEETLTARCNIVVKEAMMKWSCSGWSRFCDLSRRQTGRIASTLCGGFADADRAEKMPKMSGWMNQWFL